MWRLLVDVYQFCILGKIRAAEKPFQHRWLAPGGYYVAQWIWDTMFVLDLLSILPDQKVVIRGIFQNYWDFQRRWNAENPPFKRGFIANYIAPYNGTPRLNGKEWRTFPAFSQAPLLAWGMERVFRRNNDLELVRAGLGPLEQFHDWFWRERDLHDNGLICVGDYSGDVQRARYETYDNEVDLDKLNMTSRPGQPSGAGRWYGDICIPANTSYLLQSEGSLIRLAELCGDLEMAERRKVFLDRGIAGMRKHMWNEQQGCFLSVERDTCKQISGATVGGFVPLAANVPTALQAERMASSLQGAKWATPLSIPTVASDDPSYKSGDSWRGDVWPAPCFQIAGGLAAYGFTNLASVIADGLIENALNVGVSERYDSQSKEPLGVRYLGMSGVLVTMALDGLAIRHPLKIL